jgi:hypothetical protein
LKAIREVKLDRLLATEIAEFLPDRDSNDKQTEQFVAKLIENIYLTKWNMLP